MSVAQHTEERMQEQDVYKAHQAFGDGHPEWMQLANAVVNGWGRKEFTLQHGIALALMDAYERGERGDPPEYERPAEPRRISRTPKPAAPGVSKVRVIRRGS